MLELNRKVADVIGGFFLIGGHSVSSALLSHHFGAAVTSALAIAACVLILAGVQRLTSTMKPKTPLAADRVGRRRNRRRGHNRREYAR